MMAKDRRRENYGMQVKTNAGSLDFFIKKDVYKTPMAAMHYHVNFELYYLVQGEREYFIEDRFLRMGTGDFLADSTQEILLKPKPPYILAAKSTKGKDRLGGKPRSPETFFIISRGEEYGQSDITAFTFLGRSASPDARSTVAPPIDKP